LDTGCLPDRLADQVADAPLQRRDAVMPEPIGPSVCNGVPDRWLRLQEYGTNEQSGIGTLQEGKYCGFPYHLGNI
jgi:hypothetical protein